MGTGVDMGVGMGVDMGVGMGVDMGVGMGVEVVVGIQGVYILEQNSYMVGRVLARIYWVVIWTVGRLPQSKLYCRLGTSRNAMVLHMLS
ncbi:unnamed protein product, partial [Brenthis ino]